MKRMIYFMAPWCEPCKQMTPVLSQLQQQGINIQTVNVDQNQPLAKQYNVMSVPAVVMVKDNVKVGTLAGVRTFHEYMNMWNRF